jgi:3',5'-cyclic AMP phosphodiesterase CpdA
VTILAHVSDLHFGREDPAVAEALLSDVGAARATLLVVSGDLTQRAREAQFRACRAWLDRLPVPWLAVPGNHDVPLRDVVRRFLAPWRRWRRHVSEELDPHFEDGGVVVQGINTARRNRWKEGRISLEQIRKVRERFATADEGRLHVLVTHHPFLPAPAERAWTPMARAEEALAALEGTRIDLLLSGHQHRAYSADVERHYEKMTRRILVVHAGTSISLRRRHEPNTWNLLRYTPPHLDLEVRTFSGNAFEPSGTRRFAREPSGWRTL